MPKMISIARVDRSKITADTMAAHNAEFGAYATMLAAFPHAGDASQMAVLFDIHDMEEMRRATRSDEGDAKIRAFGFIEQLDVYHEA